MDVHSSSSTNADKDKTKNYSLGLSKSGDNSSVSASVFVNGYKDGPKYNAAGTNLTLEKSNHAVSLSAQHIPKFGNQTTAAASVNLLNKNDHRVDVNAFTTLNAPKAGPNFSTYGGGIDYQYKEKLGASASMSSTPMFKQQDYSVSGRVNLHKTPTSSLDFNVGATKTDTPFGRGNWQPGGIFTFQKRF